LSISWYLIKRRYKKSSKEITMKCPYLLKWVAFSCNAEDKPYFPSPFQLEEYCRKKEYKKCPFYSKTNNRYLDSTFLYSSL